MIRRYEDDDLEQLLTAWYLASQLAHPFLSEAFLTQERQDIVDIYLPQTDTWVYEHDDIVVGFISLMGCELGAIFVAPAFHGQGIGRALMDKAVSQRDILELEVFQENQIGRRFYAKYGFQQIGTHIHQETGFALLRLRLVIVC